MVRVIFIGCHWALDRPTGAGGKPSRAHCTSENVWSEQLLDVLKGFGLSKNSLKFFQKLFFLSSLVINLTGMEVLRCSKRFLGGPQDPLRGS